MYDSINTPFNFQKHLKAHKAKAAQVVFIVMEICSGMQDFFGHVVIKVIYPAAELL